jgi:hypothetical protein
MLPIGPKSGPRYPLAVTILGPLAGEPPEPMKREQFDSARKRLKASLDQIVTIDKREFQRLVDEVIWLKRRLHRVEDAVEPLATEIRRLRPFWSKPSLTVSRNTAGIGGRDRKTPEWQHR